MRFSAQNKAHAEQFPMPPLRSLEQASIADFGGQLQFRRLGLECGRPLTLTIFWPGLPKFWARVESGHDLTKEGAAC
jgi:hypothetical protein